MSTAKREPTGSLSRRSLKALNEGQPDPGNTASVSVTVEPGPLFEVKLQPDTLTMFPVEDHLFTVIASDQFENTISGLTYEFGSDPQAGQVDDDGRFSAATVAGHYSNAVTVEVAQGSVSKTDTVDITIEHGAMDHILIRPESAELTVAQKHQFSAMAMDAFDNPISEAEITWAIAEATGTIAQDGVVSAGTKAGDFPGGVTATSEIDGISLSAAVSVTVKPGPPSALSVASINVAASETQQLKASASDEFGNSIETVEVAWRVLDENVGSVSSSGVLTAGQVVGEFGNGIEANAIIGGLSSTTSVNISPGPLSQVVIAPNPISIGIEMTQQFVGVGADRFGNRIGGVEFTWSVEEGGGTISRNGLFSASDQPGAYANTVMAEATQGDMAVSTTATVTVEPDRIAFLSDRNNDRADLYIMEIDGSNLKRLTTRGIGSAPFARSAGGRRIVYAEFRPSGGIYIINDDGEEWVEVIGNDADTAYVEANLSPEGNKIALVKITNPSEPESREIFIIDIEGGNLTQLTDTKFGDEFVPSWSPDGSKIIYDFSENGGNGDIWVMDADGSNKKRLTFDFANDTYPSYSPDGTQILFTSARAGFHDIYTMRTDGLDINRLTFDLVTDFSPSWSPDGSRILFYSDRDGNREIYVMHFNGQFPTRLTDDPANDTSPRWAPRKGGVEATVASMAIPNSSALAPITISTMTAQAKDAVVRIEVELESGEGSGSGFVIDPEGLILTNNHVISDAETITIHLSDGSTHEGTVVGRDIVRDLAVLKIEAENLLSLEFGDISRSPLGAEVLVMGYPLGRKDLSVSRGLVSAFPFDPGRNIAWVQTDSAINPGNSGGPLLNLQGHVIGVVSAKFVGESIEGIGLAISSNTVNLFLDRLLPDEDTID